MVSDIITLAHGTGGKESFEVINKLFVKRFKFKSVNNGVGLDNLDDGSTIPSVEGDLVFTIDSYTVNPIFFRGGNIGKLAATGTLNDIAVMGGEPIAVLDSIVVEEGFPIEDLEIIINSFKEVLERYNVALLGGDFKVMPRGALDKIIITTVGIGRIKKLLVDSGLKPGDKIIVSGYIAEHGATILAHQMGIDPEESKLMSDCSPIVEAIQAALEVGGIHAAKDPTRGGLASALNELAEKSGVSIKIFESNIPIREEVSGVCEMLGVDPLYLASEGLVILGVDPNYADDVVKKLRNSGFPHAAIIGEVSKERPGYVFVETVVGGLRILEPPSGIPLPRIC